MSLSTTKPTKWLVRPVKTQISLANRPVSSVFAVHMKKPWVLSYPLNTQWRLIRLGGWWDWASQGGCPGWSESLMGAQVILLVFVMLRLRWVLYQRCLHLLLDKLANIIYFICLASKWVLLLSSQLWNMSDPLTESGKTSFGLVKVSWNSMYNWLNHFFGNFRDLGCWLLEVQVPFRKILQKHCGVEIFYINQPSQMIPWHVYNDELWHLYH